MHRVHAVVARTWGALILRLAFSLLILVLLPGAAWPVATTPAQARRVVENWLALSPKPLGAALGQQVREVRGFRDQKGNPAYYVVQLAPAGMVIVSGDDLVEPIIGFLPDGVYDPSPANTLGALVSRDLPGRVAKVREQEAQALAQGLEFVPLGLKREARRKWSLLAADTAPSAPDFAITISDIRVPPLLHSHWRQAEEGTTHIYNYYTPNNYLCGCVATAFAQFMRYHQFPTAGVGSRSFTIFVDEVAQPNTFLRGGDGLGGPYDWANMTLVPTGSASDVECRAIGALCYDAGVAVNMHYGAEQSGAIDIPKKDPLVNTFGYSNSRVGSYGGLNIPSADLNRMMNPNLDAALPVVLGVPGHYLVGDGYGYQAGTLYHHLNLGMYGGDFNIWYNLPVIDLNPPFTSIQECWYNVYKSGSGEIISGRVTDPSGNPLYNAFVTAKYGIYSYNTPTNTRGIYAYQAIPSGTTYTVTASCLGYLPQSRQVTTGWSSSQSTNVGNHWGVDFTLTNEQSLNQAVDNYSLSFTTDGQAAWVADTGTHLFGDSSARSGNLTDNQSSCLKTAIMGPGTLSFYWQVSSEANCDWLECYLDDNLQGSRISGNVTWQPRSVFIPVGVHEVKWVYVKDGSISQGNDAGFVDQVVFTNAKLPAVSLSPLLAFFPFEGNADDASGNHHHGTVTGATLASGIEGQAYYFNGTTDYIQVPLNVNPSQRPRLTIGAWVKAIAVNPVRQVLCTDNGGYDRSLCIDNRGGGTGWSAFCGSGAVLGYVPIVVDKWTFVGAVYDQATQTVKLYVDDKVLTKTGTTLGEGNNFLSIGKNPGYGQYFQGVIDNVFVFADALTPEQLSFIRSYGAAAIQTAPRTGQSISPIIGTLLLSD